jgi:hypothetical protein
MKPITEWMISATTWTLRDMLASEIIKKGPTSPDFAHAIYDLIKDRINDPDVSDDDIRNLTITELGTISGRIAQKMVEYCQMEIALSKMPLIENHSQKDSKPS